MMKLILALHLCLLFSFAQAKEKKETLLVLDYFNKKSISSPVASIDYDGVEFIEVRAKNGLRCRFSLDKMSSNLPAIKDCNGEYVDSFEQNKKENIEIFSTLNLGGVIHCQHSNAGEVVGVNITGNVKLNGTPALIHRGIVLNMQVYRDEAPEQKEDNKTLQRFGRFVLKALFSEL